MRRMLRHALLLVVLSGAATPCFSQTNPDLQTYQENFFREVGISVATRTTPPPHSTKRNRRHSEPNLKASPRNIGRRYFDMHEIFKGFQNEV